MNEHGSAAVELAFVLPVLVTLLFGIIQFGLAFFEWQGLQAAAREGARIASFSGSPEWADIEGRVLDAAAEVKGGSILVELDQGGSWTSPGAGAVPCDGTVDEVRLKVSYQQDYELNAIFFNQSIPMSAEAVFRCENSP